MKKNNNSYLIDSEGSLQSFQHEQEHEHEHRDTTWWELSPLCIMDTIFGDVIDDH